MAKTRTAPRAGGALVSVLRRDVLVRLVLLAYLVSLTLPFLARFLSFLYGVLVLAALLRGVGALPQPRERLFWRTLAAVQVLWLASVLFGDLFPGLPEPRAFLVRLLLFVPAYLLWLLAVEGQPHRPPERSLPGLERLLAWPSVTLFVVVVSVYFLFIPVATGDEVAARLGVQLLFYAVLDTYLAVRLFQLAWKARREDRWRTLYLALAAPLVVLATSHGMELLAFHSPGGWLAAAPRPWLDLTFVLTVVAARLRHEPLRGVPSVIQVPHHFEDRVFHRSAQTLSFGLSLPLLHYLAYALEVFDENGRGAHESVVSLGLAVFGTIAFLQHQLLERRARELWFERQSFERALKDSEQDLRLIVTRSEAAEVERAGQEKFDLAIRACPYPVAISRFEDGRFIEVNPAFEEALGHSRDEAVGRTAGDLGLWGSLDVAVSFYERLAEGETLREHRTLLCRKDGECVPVLFSAEVMVLEEEKMLLSIWRDMPPGDEELPPELALVDGAHLAFCVVDEEGEVLEWNGAAEALFGWTAGEVVGLPAAETFAAPDGWDGAMERLARDGSWAGELLVRRHRGGDVRVAVWGGAVDGDEEPRRRLLVLGEL